MTLHEENIYTKKVDQIDYYKNYNTSTLTLDDTLSYFTSQYSYDIRNIADSVGDKIIYSYNIINQVSEIHRYYKNVLQASVQYDYSFRSTVISDVFSDEFVQYNFDSFGHTTLITNSDNESQSFRYMNQFSENDVNSYTNTFQPNYDKNNKFICISIKHCWYWPIILNVVLLKLRLKNKFVIHSHNPLFSFCSLLNTDLLTVHDGLYYLSKSKGSRLAYILKIIERLVYYICSIVHFISNYTKEQTMYGARKSFTIIHNTSPAKSYL